MDPLSITAAGVAFAGAIGQTIKCIQRLRAIRQAPVEIKLLLEEVLDLNALLHQLEPAQNQASGASGTTVSAGEGLEWQISRTSSKLQELDSLLQEHTSKPARFGIDHLGWSKGRSRANALRGDLKVLRLNLTASFGANIVLGQKKSRSQKITPKIAKSYHLRTPITFDPRVQLILYLGQKI